MAIAVVANGAAITSDGQPAHQQLDRDGSDDSDHRERTGPQEDRLQQEDERGFEEGARGSGGRGGTIGKSDALSLMRHSISYSGNILEQHHLAREKQILRAEQWLIFTTARPLSAVFKLRVCVCLFVCSAFFLSLVRMNFLLRRVSFL
jgi:hypothetical protein